MKKLTIAIVGFAVLELYFNLVPRQLQNFYLQVISALLFFPLAHVMAKAAGLDGLRGIGAYFHKGWFKNLGISTGIGIISWLVLYGCMIWAGLLEINGVKSPAEMVMPLLEVIVGFFIGSLINDLIVRGFVIGNLRGLLSIPWVFVISIVIYCLDDYIYSPLTVYNFVFSACIGLSLTYAYYRTGSIWANTGLHFGMNVSYGLFYGLVQKDDGGIFLMTDKGTETTLFGQSITIAFTALVFLMILYAFRKTRPSNPNNGENRAL